MAINMMAPRADEITVSMAEQLLEKLRNAESLTEVVLMNLKEKEVETPAASGEPAKR